MQNMDMSKHLTIDEVKIKTIMDIKLDYLKGNISLDVAHEKLMASVDHVTAQEFALCEQRLVAHGITDDELAERMEEILKIFEGLLVSEKATLNPGHPIHTYQLEVEAIRDVLSKMIQLSTKKFIKNQWLELMEQLSQINVHFSRKQNQLYPALESKGFDKPSKVMWTLENKIREAIKQTMGLINQDEDERFIAALPKLVEQVEDMMVKEVEILFPTALEMLDVSDFETMRIGDDEIGYCLIDPPSSYGSNPTDLTKANALNLNEGLLNVSQGQLTLEQINLIYKHLKVDLSYVDENEIVKFYSDTKHRVFPRSPGVIGRKVQNCHPRESVHTVEEIIRAFKAGEQDEAEFWLEMGGKFLYIVYTAVRDDQGTFRGVLEMMQDVTHIRSLSGSQRLLNWQSKNAEVEATLDAKAEVPNTYGITKHTVIGELVKKYPYIKAHMLSLSPKFAKLNNPVIFKTMASIATLEMIAERGGLDVNEVIQSIVRKIEESV